MATKVMRACSDCGQTVLKRFGDIARGRLRDHDLLARYGGEEFAERRLVESEQDVGRGDQRGIDGAMRKAHVAVGRAAAHFRAVGGEPGDFVACFESGFSEDFGVYAMMMEIPQAKAHGLTLDCIRRMQPVERLAWRWVLFNEKAMNDVAGLSNCSSVCYEDLCRDPITQAGKLFAFSGLHWNEQTEAFIRQSTASNNASYYSIFKDPQKSANQWKTDLAAGDIERVLSVIRDTEPGRLYAGRH